MCKYYSERFKLFVLKQKGCKHHRKSKDEEWTGSKEEEHCPAEAAVRMVIVVAVQNHNDELKENANQETDSRMHVVFSQ